MTENVKPILINFISENYLKGREIEDLENVSFLDRGIIDSVAVIEIVAFLKERFGIAVEDEDIIPDNLDSINKLESYVNRKLHDSPRF